MVIVWTVKAIRSRKQSYFFIECTPKYPYNLDFAMVCCDLLPIDLTHCNDVIMNAMASRITSLTIVYSSVDPGADQRKHQSSVPLAFVSEIHRWPMNSPHKGPVTRKIFPFDDVIMHVIQRYFPGARAIARLPPVPVKQPYKTWQRQNMICYERIVYRWQQLQTKPSAYLMGYIIEAFLAPVLQRTTICGLGSFLLLCDLLWSMLNGLISLVF